MEPNITVGQTIELDRSAYRAAADVRRGDVVVFRHPGSPDRLLVKRVLGLPGERVSVRAGRVSINGAQLPIVGDGDEVLEDNGSMRYRVRLTSACQDAPSGLSVPADAFFVVGDNRCASRDSRQLGVVLFSAIDGKVAARE